MDSRDVIKILVANGWREVATRGSHCQFKHPTEAGRVTVPHPKRDLPKGTLASIARQSGLKLERQMTEYIALIHKEDDSDYGVSFPDFPGCVTGGRSMAEARAMAEEVLSLHIDGMLEDREPIPAPSNLSSIIPEGDATDAVVILVPAIVPAKDQSGPQAAKAG